MTSASIRCPALCCFGALRPLGGRPSEGQRRIGLAAGQFEIVRRRPIALEENTEPACAIDDSNRCFDAAFVPGPFQQSSRPCEAKRRAPISTCALPEEGNMRSSGKRDCGRQSKRHENLRCFGVCSVPSATSAWRRPEPTEAYTSRPANRRESGIPGFSQVLARKNAVVPE